MARLPLIHSCKTQSMVRLSLALVLLGGLGFWQAAAGSAPGVAQKSGVFTEGIQLAFGLHNEHSGTPKRPGERQPEGNGDDSGQFWLIAGITLSVFIDSPHFVPAYTVGLSFSNAAHYSPQIPRAPPLA